MMGSVTVKHVYSDQLQRIKVLMTLLCLVYSAMNSQQCANIDNALSAGNFHILMEIELNDFESLLSSEVESTYEQCTETADSGLVQPAIEIQLQIKLAQIIAELEDSLSEEKSVKLPEDLSRDVWPKFNQYILDHNPHW